MSSLSGEALQPLWSNLPDSANARGANQPAFNSKKHQGFLSYSSGKWSLSVTSKKDYSHPLLSHSFPDFSEACLWWDKFCSLEERRKRKTDKINLNFVLKAYDLVLATGFILNEKLFSNDYFSIDRVGLREYTYPTGQVRWILSFFFNERSCSLPFRREAQAKACLSDLCSAFGMDPIEIKMLPPKGKALNESPGPVVFVRPGPGGEKRSVPEGFCKCGCGSKAVAGEDFAYGH